MSRKRPFTFMLVAVSLDGKIAPNRRRGEPNPVGPGLIDPEIMELHNAQRASVDAVMVGLNCIRLDDSRLTLRAGQGANPTRIVLDGLAEMPLDARILRPDAPTIVAVTEDAPRASCDALCAAGAQVVVAGKGRFVDLPLLMDILYQQHGVRRLMVEGGGTVHRSMIAGQLYDELRLIVCPFVIGGSASVTPVQRMAFRPEQAIPQFRIAHSEVIGDYIYVTYTPRDADRDVR